MQKQQQLGHKAQGVSVLVSITHALPFVVYLSCGMEMHCTYNEQPVPKGQRMTGDKLAGAAC